MVEFSVDKIIEIDQDMNRIIGIILEEIILKVTGECIIIIIRIRITEDRIIEVDMEETIGMKTMKEVGVGPEKDSFDVIMIEGVIEA